MLQNLSSTKYFLAIFFGIISSIGLFTHKLSGEQFIVAITLILGIYTAGRVGEYITGKKTNGNGTSK